MGHTLKQLPGVADARVSYERNQAVIGVPKGSPLPQKRLRQAITEAGSKRVVKHPAVEGLEKGGEGSTSTSNEEPDAERDGGAAVGAQRGIGQSRIVPRVLLQQRWKTVLTRLLKARQDGRQTD